MKRFGRSLRNIGRNTVLKIRDSTMEEPRNLRNQNLEIMLLKSDGEVITFWKGC